INIPGCAPVGDNFTETIVTILMFLAGVGPLPEFDELGRPAWMFRETVHQGCTRAGYYEEGSFDKEYGGKKCLVELGCWGPVVQCNIVQRGAMGHAGGCMRTGGICIGCTMPGFPDAFAPFYKAPPGTLISSTASRLNGSFVRPLRRITNRRGNLTPPWKQQGEVPSGWGHIRMPNLFERAVHYFYEKVQYSGSQFTPGSAQQRKLQAEAHSFLRAAETRVDKVPDVYDHAESDETVSRETVP
nr:hypothetical protein [Pseudomonadota bacterium]